MNYLNEVRKIFTIDEDSFETFLNYEKYEDGFFWMEDRCFFAVEVVGGIYYYSTAEDLKNYYEKMTNVLRSIPDEANSSIQSLFLPYRDIEFDPPESQSDNDFVNAAYDSITSNIKKSVKDGYFNEASKLRDVKNLLFIIFPRKKGLNEAAAELELKRFHAWKEAFLKSLDMHNVDYNLMVAKEFLYAMFTLLNQEFDPIKLEYLVKERLSKQLLYNVITTTPRDIQYQDARWVMASLKSMEKLKPGLLVELMTLQRPFFVSSTLHRIGSASLAIKLNTTKRLEVNSDRHRQYADLISEASTKHCYRSEIYFGFLVKDLMEIELVRSELSAFTSEYKWELAFEDQIAPDLFRSSLPGHFNPKAARSMNIYEEHAVSLLNFRNFRQKFSPKGVILVGEDLSPKMIDIFDAQAYGTLISGGSGSGKTYFTQYNIITALASGQKVIVIDPLGNFESLCTLCGGDYHRIGVSDDSSGIDIFPDYSRDEYFRNKQSTMLVLQFLGKLVRFGDAGAKLSARIKQRLEQALEHMYTSSIKKNLSTYIDILESYYDTEKDPEIAELVASLQPFLPEKAYGGLISEAALTVEKQLIVFDISEIKEQKSLTQLAIYALMSKISPEIMRDPGQRKVVFIDEAHYLVSDPESAEFIKGGVRVWRTFNGALTMITQQLTDMLENKEVGEGIFKTLANFFMLQQSAESIRVGRSYIGYNSSEQRALNSIRTIPGKYSQVAYYTNGHRSDGNPAFGKFYLSLPRYLYWTFTTTPAERAKRTKLINEFVRNGQTLESATAQAIQQIVQEEEAQKKMEIENERQRLQG